MNNLKLLANSLEYIENHLLEDIRTEDVARACYCSKSTLEKIFRCINHTSVRNYLIRRRMTHAARMLIEHPHKSILEIALNCGYTTNESFSRAFKQIWNCQPSKFRENPRILNLYPKLALPSEERNTLMKNHVNFDISELYDLFTARKDCYFVCCDIKNLISINSISYHAGDCAILEAMKRMHSVAGKEDMVFRIGGDEFVMLTNNRDLSYAQKLAAEIQTHNNEYIFYNETPIPLKLHVTITQFENDTLKSDELFTKLQSTLTDCK